MSEIECTPGRSDLLELKGSISQINCYFQSGSSIGSLGGLLENNKDTKCRDASLPWKEDKLENGKPLKLFSISVSDFLAKAVPIF